MPFARALHRQGGPHGLAVWTLRNRYRGWNGEDMSPVHDARWALARISQEHPGVPVYLLGHSMGGLTALCVADDPQVEAVVALAPWLNHKTPVQPVAGRRVLIVHGTDDRWTSPANSLDYARRADGVAASVDYVSLKECRPFHDPPAGTVERAGERLRPGRLRRGHGGRCLRRHGRIAQRPRRRPAGGRNTYAGGVVMPPFPLDAFLASLPWVIAGLVVLLAVTFAVAVRQNRHSVIDTVWGLGFVVVAGISWVLSAGYGDAGRRLLLLALVAVWGIRLAVHIGARARGGHEDPRYVDMLSAAPGSRNVYALRRVYLPQGVVMFFVSLTIQVGMFATGSLGWLAFAGVLLWILGFVFETVGDWQLTQFKADPARRGTVLNTGLWRYTRHPNYFGDAAVWAGLFLVAADSWPGVLTVLSPALMIWTLAGKTGKPLTEKAMSARPGYKEYIDSTSGFLPWPPRRRVGGH